MTFGRIHLLSIVNDFLLSFPEINVRMALSDRNMNLVDDHIDAAVRIGQPPDSGLITTSLGSIRRIVCGSPDYFKQNGNTKNSRRPRRPDLRDFANLPSGSLRGPFPSEARILLNFNALAAD